METGDFEAVLSRIHAAVGLGAVRLPFPRQISPTLIGWPLSSGRFTRRIHMRKFIAIAALLTFHAAHAQAIRNGEDLLRAMHERYKNSWYQTVTFVQKSTTYKADGTASAETWYEAAEIPGKLRIDIGPARDGNGYLFVDGTLTVIKDNKVAATHKDTNMLLVLGFDVYRQDPAKTAA